MGQRRTLLLRWRLVVYIAVIAVLVVVRGGDLGLDRLKALLSTDREGAGSLVVAGRDLMPGVVDQLLAGYAADAPDLAIATTDGSTNQALEDLYAGHADVAFLMRRPSPQEQALAREARADTARVWPVALGAMVVLAGAEADTTARTLSSLTHALLGGARLYATDPNDGIWPAFCARLGLADDWWDAAAARVTFLADPAAVVASLEADPSAWGLVSSFRVPTDRQGLPRGVGTALRLREDDDPEPPAPPSRAQVAGGRYPLPLEVLVACMDQGSFEGARFVTHLTSARGQRLVERAGVLPARHVAREIYLTRTPLGE
jgi:ABC-type phosphate transport system substrate-binding protein